MVTLLRHNLKVKQRPDENANVNQRLKERGVKA